MRFDRRPTSVSLLAVVAFTACDVGSVRRPVASADVPDERPTRVELVVADDSAPPAAMTRADSAAADSLAAARARWPTTVIRFQGTEGAPLSLWAGDTVQLPTPTPPDGTPDDIVRDLRWSSEDPAIALVSRDGTVIGRRPGSTVVVAWRRVGRVSTPVTVLPAARGRVFLADRGAEGVRPSDSLSAVVGVLADAGWHDSVVVDATGRYVWRASRSVGRAAEFVVLPTGTTADRYFSSNVGRVLTEKMGHVSVVFIPRRWRIESGSYAGTTLDIQPPEAVARLRDGSRFWRLSRANPAGGSGRPIGWPVDRFPIPVALRTGDDDGVRGADSVAFWAAARQLERDWGSPLFVPASPDAAVRYDWTGISVQIDPRIPADGFTTSTSNGDGNVNEAQVAFRSRAYLRDAGIVTHELMHALGLGHSERQESVMRTRGALPRRASAEDIGYGRLLYAVRGIQARWKAEFGLAEVVDY